MPLSLASLNLITQTTSSFSHALLSLAEYSDSVMDKLSSVKKLYEIVELPNKVVDGELPFPDNHQSLEFGMTIEFR